MRSLEKGGSVKPGGGGSANPGGGSNPGGGRNSPAAMSLGVVRLLSLHGDGWAEETGVELGTDSALVDRFGRTAFEFDFDVGVSLA